MSSYWGGAWTSLKFSVGSSTDAIMSNIGYRYLKRDGGNLTYRNNRAYKYVAVHVAKQMAMQAIEGEVNKLFPRYQRYLEKENLKQVRDEQNSLHVSLISRGDTVDKPYGKIDTNIIARNKYGEKVDEALIIWYEAIKNVEEVVEIYTTTLDNGEAINAKQYYEKTHPFSSKGIEYKSNIQYISFPTTKRFVIDLAPRITINSTKNLLLTKVQGRDFTRKELISGGDLCFSVSGEFNSNIEGVYPSRDVQKFINIMQHNGVLCVNNLIFGQLNVTKILIQSYQLGHPSCKNVQPYSFTCVAVEPDEDVTIANDTIEKLNYDLSTSPAKGWERFVLNSKLAELTANAVSGTVSSLTNAGLDALVPNI